MGNPWTIKNGLEIVNELPVGSGGFGCVWKAQHKDDKEFYAIKQIYIARAMKYYYKKDESKQLNHFQKILREIENHSKIQTSFAVRYFGYWIEGPDRTKLITGQIKNYKGLQDQPSLVSVTPKNFLFIQMEFCEYITLTQWLKDNPTFEERKAEVRRILNQLSKAMMDIHSLGIIHRDLKPDNIISTCNTSTKQGIWKIADFGLSISFQKCDTDQGRSISTSTVKHPTFAGTLRYQSPEMIDGDDYTESTDVYSLGLIFLQILSTFPSENEEYEVFHQLQTLEEDAQKQFIEIDLSKYVSSSEFQKEVTLLQKMLLFNPKSRPTAQHLFNATLTPFTIGLGNVQPNFVGRTKELNDLNITLQEGKFNMVAVTGQSARIGKSELVRYWLHSHSSSGICRVWIQGLTNSLMAKSVIGLAQDLDIPTRNHGPVKFLRDIADIGADILESIRSVYKHHKIVYVIDNLTDLNDDFDPSELDELRKCNNILFVFIGEQIRPDNPIIKYDKIINLHEWEPEESSKFISESLKCNDDSSTKLSTVLNRHPSSIRRAVNIIRQTDKHAKKSGEGYSCESFMADYQDQRLHDYALPSQFPKSNIASSEIITCMIALDKVVKINKEEAQFGIKYLEALSYLEPSGINLDLSMALLEKLYLESEPNLTTNQPFDYDDCKYFIVETWYLLFKFNLLEFASNLERTWVLPSAKAAVQLRMKTETSEQAFLSILFKTLTSKPLHYNDKQLLNNLGIVWNKASRFEALVKQFAEPVCHLSTEFARMKIAKETLEFQKYTWNLFIESFGPMHKHTLQLHHNYGQALHALSRNEEACNVYESLLRIILTPGVVESIEYNDESGMYYSVCYHMANSLQLSEKYEQALHFYNQVRGKEVLAFGEELKIVECNIAHIFYMQDKDLEATKLYEETLKWQLQNLGEAHYATLKTLGAIAYRLFNLGRFADAKPIFEKIVDAHSRVFGENSIEATSAKSLLASTLNRLGQAQEAVNTLYHVIHNQILHYGTNSPQVEVTRQEINDILDTAGQRNALICD